MIGSGRPPKKEAPLFGQRLRSARIATGLTQIELAQRLEISPKMMDYYERRAPNPSSEFVLRCATVLGVTVEDLIGSPASRSQRAKPGPTPRLMERFERIQRLPRSRQEFLIKFLDTYLDGVEKAS